MFLVDILHWRSRQVSEMWVEFHLDGESANPVVKSCLIGNGNERIDLEGSERQGDLVAYLLLRTRAKCTEDLLKKGVVKLNMKPDDVQQLVPEAVAVFQQSASFSGCEGAAQSDMQAVVDLLREQQAQIASQQEALMQLLSSTLNTMPSRRDVMRPDIFDGHSQSADTWLALYEHSCERNGWLTDADKVDNLYFSLTDAARKWYESRLTGNKDSAWTSWRESFLNAFAENLAEKWSEAIAFTYSSGSITDYYFEKARLIRRAECRLPEESVVALVQHGLPKELRRLTQVRAPRNTEELLRCFRDLGAETQTPPRQWSPTAPPQQGTFPRHGRFQPRPPLPRRTTAHAEEDTIHPWTEIDQQKNE